ncbi:MAG: sodium-dependent transporter [Ignavibacterium sp.]|nr:sodium-dependent transporter [Ignavibacterium sp.]MDW8374913.1 sodium-dependent transporter [Ignavibacteriales bacterium]
MSENLQREKWGSKIGFVLAAAGSAIGLGNIWKFPYVAGQNGGAAFFIIYIFCVILIGLPVIIAEIILGRTAQKNPVGAFKKLSDSKFWPWVGAMGVFAGFIILSFYSVVAGWSVGYVYESATGVFYNFNSAQSAAEHFNHLTKNVTWGIGMLAIFILMTMFFVYAGVQKGIEKGSKIMMPLLFILLIIVMIRGITLEGSDEGLAFIFHPDWSKVTPKTFLEALGQAFFSLSLGMGAMLTYGSYMSRNDNVPKSSLEIVVLDTLVAVIAGVAIFTAVFATGQNAAQGPGLIFHTLPIVFTKMPGGYFVGIIFFILLTIAALTSAISLLEVVTAYFVDEKNWSRHKAVLVFGSLAFLVGIPSVLSFNIIENYKIFGMNFFDVANYLSSNIMLPLGGLLIAIFVGNVWGIDKVLQELKQGSDKLFTNYSWIVSLWVVLIKYVSPILILFVLLQSIGVF